MKYYSKYPSIRTIRSYPSPKSSWYCPWSKEAPSPKQQREELKQELIRAGNGGIRENFIDPAVLKPMLKKGLVKRVRKGVLNSKLKGYSTCFTAIVWGNSDDFGPHEEPEERVPYKKRNQDLKDNGLRYSKSSLPK